MKNIPSSEEVITYFKDRFKIILITIVSFLVVFALGVTYTIYTDNKIEGNTKDTVEETNLLKGIDATVPLEEQLSPEEIKLIVDNLQKNGMKFSFYLEKEPTDPFQATDLIKELLISPSVLKDIEKEINMKIKPSPELAVNVDLDSENLLITVTIGTGDVKMNKLLTEAYFTMISEERNPFFDNKIVYIMSEPEVIKPNSDNELKSTDILSPNSNNLSFKRIAILTIIVIIAGAFTGIILCLVRSILAKEVSELYGFAIKDDDTILNINSLKIESESEQYEQIVHSIIHPNKKVKLVLSENNLEEGIIIRIKEESIIQVGRTHSLPSEAKGLVIIANSILDIDPKIDIDEIIFICIKNKTSKVWYEKQRKLLGVYKSKTKVILV